MPKCKNCAKYYTGREPSPRGIGYHASVEAVGCERVGRNNQVWRVEVYGPQKTKRWVPGRATTSRFVAPGQVLAVDAMPMEPGVGLLAYPGANPYVATSWCPYGYEVVDAKRIRVVRSDLGITEFPVLLEDFIEIYKRNARHG